jgi:plasmid stabilization system protein ParE
MVTTYKLSPAATVSIDALVTYTDETFGMRQTAAYIAGLESSFELLMNFPGIGAAAFEVKARLRRYRYY